MTGTDDDRSLKKRIEEELVVGPAPDPGAVGAPVTDDPQEQPLITTSECAEMRRLRRDGETLETVADTLGRSVTAVSRHATGAEGCNHDPERVGEPVTTEMSTGHRRDAITPPECAAIRARRRAGQTLVAVADAIDRSRSSVGDHAQGAGGCDHD